MNQKEKEALLINDLSSRLRYGVKAHTKLGTDIVISGVLWGDTIMDETDDKYDISFIKPYLRPKSSMTEEEKIELYQIAGFYYLSNNELLKDEWRQFSDALSENKLFLPYSIWEDDLNKVYDWLNAHHFDYRGLIEKGLAIEASSDMYK